ncbi:CPBP family intramembrane glutamic endopeptidase [Paenibacillus sp. DMB20]|uniref:CPBP family intramembrane glutamic endopeptidase n=1 Tax=Paenibacillus sp. DMB20 TaxID=1642570 RepID=UPI0006995D46|nr:CPBP family intramembrane glutamic endopeptidase [Paenibacillus sp. DMB20]
MSERKEKRLFWFAFIIFTATVIGGQILPLSGAFIGGFLLAGVMCTPVSPDAKKAAGLCAALLTGYGLYALTGPVLKAPLEEYGEWSIIASRMALTAWIMPFFVLGRFLNTEVTYLTPGGWSHKIYFPLILKGPVQDPIWRFLIIFAAVAVFSFSWMIDWNQPDIVQLLVYAFGFSAVNAILEEILWRGYILSGFAGLFGEVKGIFIAGTGFGFYHLHLGFSWWVCLLFAVFGWMMSAVAVRSQGLLPVIAMHFMMNMLFVLSGMIF